MLPSSPCLTASQGRLPPPRVLSQDAPRWALRLPRALRGLANFPTGLGKFPYGAWQISLRGLATVPLQVLVLARTTSPSRALQVFSTSFFTCSSTPTARVPLSPTVASVAMLTAAQSYD